MTRARRTSVYVHFPWCLRKCAYCDFVSYPASRADIPHAAYADAVIRELGQRVESLAARGGAPRQVGSVFFGGGTPSLWDPAQLSRVLAAVRTALPCDEALEVTVECNPTSLDEATGRALHAAGVNRVSLGVQSLRADQLAFLGRLHDPEGAQAALDAAIASGVPRVSTDLIFGLPGQAAEDACAQAQKLVRRGLAHLSCYQLTVEAGTPLSALLSRGRLPRPDDGAVADTFLALDRTLRAEGLDHYEISNYARPGEEARHNLGYWRGEEYLGLGCAAFGFWRDDTVELASGVRYRNDLDPRRYVESTASAAGVRARETRERLDAEMLLRERIMLGLRLAVGVDLAAAGEDVGTVGWTHERTREASRLVARGRLVHEGHQLRIPAQAWLWSDDTAARLF